MSNNLAATAELRYRSTMELCSMELSSLFLRPLLVKLRSGSKERTDDGAEAVDNAFNGRERATD